MVMENTKIVEISYKIKILLNLYKIGIIYTYLELLIHFRIKVRKSDFAMRELFYQVKVLAIWLRITLDDPPNSRLGDSRYPRKVTDGHPVLFEISFQFVHVWDFILL